jgi:hypothetical protein
MAACISFVEARDLWAEPISGKVSGRTFWLCEKFRLNFGGGEAICE